ncbi:MAG: hypothetical protein WBD36_02720 [Bacteroidota bacterium]
MSLKGFHIFFIGIATLCTFGFGIWLLTYDGRGPVEISGAVGAFLCSLLLVLYGRRFLRKFRHISSM